MNESEKSIQLERKPFRRRIIIIKRALQMKYVMLVFFSVLVTVTIVSLDVYYIIGKLFIKDLGDAKAIEEGALAYLGQQFKMMSWFVIILTILLFAMYRNVYAGDPALRWIPLGISLSFLMGVLASYGAGFVGMWLAVKKAQTGSPQKQSPGQGTEFSIP